MFDEALLEGVQLAAGGQPLDGHHVAAAHLGGEHQAGFHGLAVHQHVADDTPWTDLDEAGTGLTVDNFLTTMLSQLITSLRHTVTLPYAEQFDLTVPEWRILALLAHARQLEARGLVTLESEGNTPRKKLFCSVTEAGIALHDRVMPLARQAQAEVIRRLAPEERRAVYLGLRKLLASQP